MKPEQAVQFLQALGGKPEQYQGGGWVRSPCLLARWTHAGGKDTNPSFGVSVGEAKHSHFNCFACQSGSAEQLLQTMEMYYHKNPQGPLPNFAAARQLLEQEHLDVFPLPAFAEFPTDELNHFEEWPEWFLDQYPLVGTSNEAWDYLLGRGVPGYQIMNHDLRWDENRNMVVFPFRTVWGKLAGARGRSIKDWGMQHYDYSFNKGNNTHNTWYNEQVLETEQPVIVVEGQFDCLTMERVYPHVLANLTARAMPAKLKKLQGSPGVIMCLDNDKTGKEALARYLQYFNQHKINCAVLELPEGIKDPDQAGTEILGNLLTDLGVI